MTTVRTVLPAPLTNALIAICIAHGFFFSGCQKQSESPKAPRNNSEISVQIAPVELNKAVRRINIVGTLFGAEQVTVSTEVAGTLQRCVLDVGDAAIPSETLARIDPTDYRLSLKQAEESLSEIMAKLGGQSRALEDLNVRDLTTVKRAEAELSFAQFEYQRLASLQTTNTDSSVSEREINDALMGLRVAEANERTARDEGEALLAQAYQRRSAVELARWRFSQTTVKIPPIPSTAIDFVSKLIDENAKDAPGAKPDGPQPGNAEVKKSRSGESLGWRVAERMVTEGQFMKVGDPLYRLVIVNPLKLLGKVPERYVNQIEVNQPVDVEGSIVNEKLRGRVTRINPTTNPQTRTFDIEIFVDNSRETLKAGGFGKAAVIAESTKPLILIPQSAIVEFAGVTKAFLLKDGVARQRELVAGDRFGTQVEITEGLNVGDELILSPPRDLLDGQAVQATVIAAGKQKPEGGTN